MSIRVSARAGRAGLLSRREWSGPVALTALLTLIGIWWGWTEIWNPDPMAFKDLFRKGSLPFSPPWFFKPPLLTYISFFLVVAPAKVLEMAVKAVTGIDEARLAFIGVWLAKLLQVAFACGATYLLHRVARIASSPRTALIIALLFATCAGMIVQAHFVSTDLPLVFMMIAGFAAAQRLREHRTLAAYAFAGVVAGLAGAMKYNGLAVAAAIPAFHFAAIGARDWHKSILTSGLFASGFGIIGGFLLGNPFAVIEFPRFLADFRYEIIVSPHYSVGEAQTSTFADALALLPQDLMGWPLTLTIVAALVTGIVIVARRSSSGPLATPVAAVCVVALYLAYFGTRSHVQVRWMLAIVPFLLLASIPFWTRVDAASRRFTTALAAALVAYGLVCSIDVGLRFASDPRMASVDWMREHATADTTVESGIYTPKWNVQRGVTVADDRVPRVSGRKRLFLAQFPDRPDILARTDEIEPEDVSWFDAAALATRKPDLIAVDSLAYERFNGALGAYYPEMRRFYQQLLGGQLGYRAVFDRMARRAATWLYPRDIEFLDNRMLILERTGARRAE